MCNQDINVLGSWYPSGNTVFTQINVVDGGHANHNALAIITTKD